jgi:hypothetical protein
MNDKLSELCRAFVGVASMPQQKLGKMTELVDGEVGGERCLFAFFSHNADTWW